MARAVFVFACLLLVGIWIHPYVSGAFETRQPQAVSAAAEASLTPAHRPESESPFVTMRGREGFWRLGKTEDGVWWFVSPEGKREFLNTVTTVQPFQVGRDAQGVSFISRDWDGSLGKYDGDLEAWARKTVARVQDSGFKGLGAWCHPVLHGQNIPITRDLNLWRHYSASDFRLYHPDFVKTMDSVVEKAVAELKHNKNLVGYFTDNELDWSDATIGPRHYFDGLPVGDPNRVQVINTIKSLWPKLDDYNAAWNVSLKDWRELDTQPVLNREPETAYTALFNAWLEKAAGDYFRITSASLRKLDPHHLILGVRFAGNAPREVVRASRDHTDAQSLNYYVPDAQLDPEMFAMMYRESGQPIILSEYGFHALDNRSGARNTCGFQAQVPDQQARAEAYQLFTSRLARVPYVVGADWFQWSDEPPSGRGSDGEDVNFGVVDVDDKLYEQLADAIRQTTPRLNPLHAVSGTDTGRDVFRSDFSRKPTAKVVKLERPINLNGELSDWNEAFRVGGMQRTETVGIARSEVRMPNLYMGWHEEGLYVAAEVFTSHLETTAATGRWWTRDHLEMWFSTRPVGVDQQTYNAFCHQFFFVPEVSPTDGRLGTVGQWHRPGDAIKENIVPSPKVQQSTRLLPGRYVVEMFFPASVLNGWNPMDHPELAFNFYARDFGASSDYFWSAPKEVQTNVRPNTWGRLILSGPQMALGQ
ncbi:MAG TPA: hypothetical protein VF595_13995 [Tepidisphaeraceae bacterium]|jgi:hypothetical protein